MENLLLIDASNIAYFIANTLDSFELDDELHIEGFLTFVHRRMWLTSGFPVTPIWCLDSPTYWRETLEPEYKAHRRLMVKHLNVKPVLRTLKRLGFPAIAVPTFEADDIAAAMIKRGGYGHCYVLTTDSDWMGFVGPHVTHLCPTFKPNIRNLTEVWAVLYQKWNKQSERVKSLWPLPPLDEKFTPQAIWAWKAATGDVSDNLPEGTVSGLIDLFNPIVPLRLDILETALASQELETIYWHMGDHDALAQGLPDQPFTPIRIGEY